jgi:hypothetical protein
VVLPTTEAEDDSDAFRLTETAVLLLLSPLFLLLLLMGRVGSSSLLLPEVVVMVVMVSTILITRYLCSHAQSGIRERLPAPLNPQETHCIHG